MLSPEEKPQSVAAQLQAGSRDPTLAPSTVSTIQEKDAVSTSAPAQSHSSMESSRDSRLSSAGAHEPGALAKTQTAKTENGEPIQQIMTREDGSEYPKGMKLTLITVALCLSVFLISLE
jgi:hypothetical protein